MRSRGENFHDQNRKPRFQGRVQASASLRNGASLTERHRRRRNISPNFICSLPGRPHSDEPEERVRGGRSFRDRSGLLSRDLPLHPPSGQDPRKRTEPNDEPRKNHGVEPRANSEVLNRRPRRSYGSGGKERTRERKRTSRRFPTSRPQERKVSPRRQPAYLRESRRQPDSLLSAYDGPHEQSPLLHGGGLSGRLGSRGQEARHAPPNKPRRTPSNDQSSNQKPLYAEVVVRDVGEKLDKTTTHDGCQYVHPR